MPAIKIQMMIKLIFNKYFIFCFAFFSSFLKTQAQLSESNSLYSHQDTLRGSIGEGRKKWNVLHYDITVSPDILKKTISGFNEIQFIDSGVSIIQIDLQEPMQIDSIKYINTSIPFTREENVYWVKLNADRNNEFNNNKPSIKSIMIYFQGKPKQAVMPPWDGGWIWKKDKNNNPWVSVACQGLGASVWYPCKDTQSDEPDSGCNLKIIVPDSLVAVGNGRLLEKTKLNNGNTSYNWEVKNPINNYNIIPYIGKYVNFSEKYLGLNGTLDLNYWVLNYNEEKAKKQFADVKRMLKAFEYWFGPYPFYKDGYKLVEAPHLGMEHQSSIAYGNEYLNGYLGIDRSKTGWGLKWDFIIVHESGHEWFGNNITTNDIADMWVHESFTNYSETLFTEYFYGKKAADAYTIGLRKNINNDRNIIGPYGVNKEGSGDMYDKGANMIHTIRQIINNDSLFKNILTGLNKTFYHKTISGNDIESFISKNSGIDFTKVFDQYLSTTKIPVLEYYFKKGALYYRWSNCINEFDMPVKYKTEINQSENWLFPTTNWKKMKINSSIKNKEFFVNENFYIGKKNLRL